MARTSFKVEDSFASIFQDLQRVGSDAGTEMRKELGAAVGDIIDHTPQDSGMAASGWLAASAALQSKHQPVVDEERWSKAQYGYNGKLLAPSKVIRSGAWGRRMGKYEENVPFTALKRAIKRGDIPDRLEFTASNSVKHMTFLEYGVSYIGSGAKGVSGHFGGEVNGFAYAVKPRHIVRDAMRRMKQRIGPAFAKALRANIKRPKRYQKTVVQ